MHSHLQRSIIITALAWVSVSQVLAQKQEIYFGEADRPDELINYSSQWTYVQQHADGYYINFIELNKFHQDLIDRTAALFAHKNALIESDMHDATGQKDRDYIDKLQTAGFTIPYTSLNYGWSESRADNLKTYALGAAAARLNFVQDGPWSIGGDIAGDHGLEGEFSNANFRNWIAKADGFSTDGPMGFWFDNHAQMREGSYSMVQYAHHLGKKAIVMLCPYTSGSSDYHDDAMWLSTAISCVQAHEDHDADADIWDVFEYASLQAVVPEQVNGAAANTTTGMAYYLLKHRDGDPGTLHLLGEEGNRVDSPASPSSIPSGAKVIHLDPSAAPGKTYQILLKISNSSTWLDYAAALQATVSGSTSAWQPQFKMGDTDVTSSIGSATGFILVGADRLNPRATRTLHLYLTRTSFPGDASLTLSLKLLPHRGSEAVDSLQITTAETAVNP